MASLAQVYAASGAVAAVSAAVSPRASAAVASAPRTSAPASSPPAPSAPTPSAPGRLVRGAGRVPGEGAGLFEADEHVGAEVLDRLERPDGPPELFAHGGVGDGGVQAPGGGAAGVCGEEDGGQVTDEPGVGDRHGPVRRYVDGVGPHLGCGPGRVDAAVRAHGEPLRTGVHEEPALTVGRGGGQQEQVGGVGAQDGRGGAVEVVAARERGGGEGAGAEGEGGGAVPGGQRPEQVTGPGAHCPPQHRAHQRGREVRPRQRSVRGLLQDHGEVEEVPAATAVRLGQMDAGQPLPGERFPVGGAHAGGRRAFRVEELAHLAGWCGARQPPPYGVRQRAVLLGDADAGTDRRTPARASAHARLRRSQPLERRKSRTRFNLTEGQEAVGSGRNTTAAEKRSPCMHLGEPG